MSGEKESPEEGNQVPSNRPEGAAQGGARSGGKCWGWMAISIILIVLMFAAFKAVMNLEGYCFAEQKTLSDNEKIRAVVRHVLKKYPPAVIRTPVDSRAWSVSSPDEPIHYKDVDEFLTLNPGCCELTETRNPEEGGPYFMERLTGTVSGYARIDYLVLYREDGVVKSVQSKNHLAISNCGKPARKWHPGDYFFGFHPSNLSD